MKGTFQTPRPVGTVSEIRISAIKVRLDSTLEFQIAANLEEGNEVDGVFEVTDKGTVSVLESDLSAADQVLLNNFLKVILREYINTKGYSNVTVT